ncbi:hypothetical protein [Segetibacter koreensis]|uniref:hypothetical protein n=1 Tax=Segetibacter koreensis TaxID=398037 RepID=UPI000380787E|nr:hypothetical protein [Segetibacter koreensis]
MATLFTQHLYQPKNKSVVRLVRSFQLNYSHTFTKVRNQWLPAIREFLREETGLKMHQKVIGTKIQKDSNISFHFVTDREETFLKLIDQHYLNLDFDEYTAFNKLRLQMQSSSRFFKKEGEGSAFLLDILEEKPHASFHELENYLDDYFKQYDLNKLIQTLFKNAGRTADIWGTYTYASSRVEVYYVPLILFCQINNLPLEHSILSTLVHEMAHAYHHLGKDKDNSQWSAMNVTDKHIVEGMAEYFTWLFIEAYKDNHPGMEKTYSCMFNCLADEYTCFKKWTPTYSKEAIKSALLSTRRKGVKDYNEFLKLLQSVKTIMH